MTRLQFHHDVLSRGGNVFLDVALQSRVLASGQRIGRASPFRESEVQGPIE